MENIKCKNQYFQNNNKNDSNQIEEFVMPKNLTKHKISDNKDLNNFAFLNHFKVVEYKERNQTKN